MSNNRITHHSMHWTEEYREKGVQIRQTDGTMQWFPTVISTYPAPAPRPEHWWQDPEFWMGAYRGGILAHVIVAVGLVIAILLSFVQWLLS